MKKMIGSLVLAMFLFGSVVAAKEKVYPITLNVEEEQNIENAHASIHFGFSHGVGGGSVGHNVTKHVFAEGSDGNAYDMVPKNSKDFIIPGNYPARFDKRDVIVKVNGREIKLLIVDVKRIPTQEKQ